jgi:hypothetical protein
MTFDARGAPPKVDSGLWKYHQEVQNFKSKLPSFGTKEELESFLETVEHQPQVDAILASDIYDPADRQSTGVKTWLESTHSRDWVMVIDNLDDTDLKVHKALIDLDLAIREERVAVSGASHRTGTPHFMSLGVLAAVPHTYRHDLESFFWVLLWIATFYTPASPKSMSA